MPKFCIVQNDTIPWQNLNMNTKSVAKKSVKYIDSVLGRILRHMVFSLVRPYYSLFYNVSCSNKEKLQGLDGAIVLSSHVSRHDPPLILSALYSVTRMRPTAYYKEYEHWAQHYPMVLFGTIPMSSPKTWAPERREEQKARTLEIMSKVLANGNSILIFPAGGIRKGEKEEIPPYLTGSYDTICAHLDKPVVLIRVDGLGLHQYQIYDQFWSFLGLAKGRRHVKMDVEITDNLSMEGGREAFNQRLEDYFNGAPLSLLENKTSQSEEQ